MVAVTTKYGSHLISWLSADAQIRRSHSTNNSTCVQCLFGLVLCYHSSIIFQSFAILCKLDTLQCISLYMYIHIYLCKHVYTCADIAYIHTCTPEHLDFCLPGISIFPEFLELLIPIYPEWWISIFLEFQNTREADFLKWCKNRFLELNMFVGTHLCTVCIYWCMGMYVWMHIGISVWLSASLYHALMSVCMSICR